MAFRSAGLRDASADGDRRLSSVFRVVIASRTRFERALAAWDVASKAGQAFAALAGAAVAITSFRIFRAVALDVIRISGTAFADIIRHSPARSSMKLNLEII
ncbi:hypothetical protein QR78_02675 [Methylobacterium indicum]|uniref:ABC transmembrane type-1 domain-containing protein n=1 Tax=Methylobacterium indicum TaxID=1775910 RepID=A0ABR5HI48_9HYPH|nr:hypothetical protein QR78_02675 [Methylobacterium indicum]KMO26334.1 hypothetical protein QR79_03050 [Methylobacterium indicum]